MKNKKLEIVGVIKEFFIRLDKRSLIIFASLIILCAIIWLVIVMVRPSADNQSVPEITVADPSPAASATAVNPNFKRQVDKCFIPIANLYGYELRITSDFRSQAEQDKLYEQGRSENGHIVSWAVPGKSMHNYGFAVDVVDRWHGYNADWKKLNKIAKFCSLEQVDDPHFEHRGGLSTEQFEAGLRPPELELPCSVMSERASTDKPLTLEDLELCGAPSF